MNNQLPQQPTTELENNVETPMDSSANKSKSTSNADVTIPEKQKGTSKNKWFKIFVILAVILMLLVGFSWYAYTIWYPRNVVKQYVNTHLKTLRAKDYATAYNQTTAGFKEKNTQEEYQKFADVQGLSSGDIKYSITKAMPFTNERNLTKHAEIVFELKGDTGQIQPVRVMLIKELGDYKVRLIELPGETNPGSWIGFKYLDEEIPDSQQVALSPSPMQEDVMVKIDEAVDSPAVTTAPSNQAESRDWKIVVPDSGIGIDTWDGVVDSSVILSAQVAGEQHYGYVRFPTEESLVKAIDQLHPLFKAKETPDTYMNFLKRVGIINVKDVSVNTGDIVVKDTGSQYVAKVELKLKDYSTTDGSTTPEEKKIYIGMVATPDANGRVPFQEWEVISMFTEEYIKVNPSFFPY